MKKMLSLFSAIMIRPTIYRAVTKCAVMLTVVLLWDQLKVWIENMWKTITDKSNLG